MSGFLFSKKFEAEAELIIDIGSKSVGGGIFEKDSNGSAKLLYTAREPISFQTKITGENLLSSAVKSLSNLLLHLEKYGINHLRTPSGQKYRIRSAVIIISSPWHSSETKLLRLNFGKPVTITKSFINEILDKEEKSFENELKGSARSKNDFCQLERKIIEMRLNGYSTGEPYGKETENLEIQMFNSVIPVKILEKIESLVSRYFHIENFIFHTFSVASFASIRESFPEIKDFLIVQVGGEITDIVVVKKGNISETISFPLGHNGLLRVLEKICSNHPRCSLEALVTLHRETGATAADKLKVEKAIKETKSLWLDNFNKAISNFSDEAFIPNTIFLFEENPYSSIFEHALRETSVNTHFTVKVFGQEMADKSIGTGVIAQSDPILSMETDFAASVDQSSYINVQV